jgi:hypothetical protein
MKHGYAQIKNNLGSIRASSVAIFFLNHVKCEEAMDFVPDGLPDPRLRGRVILRVPWVHIFCLKYH